jgi:hypothetical protein
MAHGRTLTLGGSGFNGGGSTGFSTTFFLTGAGSAGVCVPVPLDSLSEVFTFFLGGSVFSLVISGVTGISRLMAVAAVMLLIFTSDSEDVRS